MRTCTKCHKSKPESEFYKAHSRKDGLTTHCKACMNLHNAQYQREHRRGKHLNKTKIYIADLLVNELEIVFLEATGCNFADPDDIEMAIRILLAKD